jgi:hypothetical protein
MRQRRRVAGAAVAAGACAHVLAAGAGAANPEVKPHEIARFIMLKSSCVLLDLHRVNPEMRPPRFHATCKNVSNWPDGMDIECAEHDDDRSCRALTPEREFKHLELLRPAPGN